MLILPKLRFLIPFSFNAMLLFRDKDEKEEFSRPPKTYTEEDVSTLADMRTYDKGGIFR